MATEIWNGGSGNWNDPTQWNNGSVPGSGNTDDALIEFIGLEEPPYTIEITASVSPNSIVDDDDPNATILVDNGVALHPLTSMDLSEGTLTNFGLIPLSDATLTIAGTDDSGNTNLIGGNGTIVLSNASTLDAGNFDGTVQFNDNTDLAIITANLLDHPGTLTGDITGFQHGDIIDLGFLSTSGPTEATWAANKLHVIDNTGTVFTINMPGKYTGIPFAAVSDQNGGIEILNLACYLAGTRIATTRGEVAVEHLRIGDEAVLARGGTAPVSWLGHRQLESARFPRQHEVWPIRVRASAFGAGQPARDLLLSPDHAVFVDDVLIPVRYLVNGRTIVQEVRNKLTYWHVELPRHEVILAEGLPCESYRDTGNRSAFSNGGPVVQFRPDFAAGKQEAPACAPLIFAGADVEAARSLLLERAEILFPGTTGDADLRVVAAGHEVIPEIAGDRWHVRLPAGADLVRLTSRAWIPAATCPDEADHRSLGVAISRLWLDRREVSLESTGLSTGWHDPEPGVRWTDGDAELRLAGAREFTFEVAMTGTYARSRKPSPSQRQSDLRQRRYR